MDLSPVTPTLSVLEKLDVTPAMLEANTQTSTGMNLHNQPAKCSSHSFPRSRQNLVGMFSPWKVARRTAQPSTHFIEFD
jgi:hypothetical protein